MRDPDAVRLLNWKKPIEREVQRFLIRTLVSSYLKTIYQKASGDFHAVLYEVVSKRSSVIEGSLSVEDLNQILDELVQNIGKQYVLSAF